jgi:hypothetical protein
VGKPPSYVGKIPLAQWEKPPYLSGENLKPTYSAGKSSQLSGKNLPAKWGKIWKSWKWKNMLEWRQELRERVKISPTPRLAVI